MKQFLVLFIYFTFPNTFIFFLPFLPSLPFLYIPPEFLTKVSLSNRSKTKQWIFFLKKTTSKNVFLGTQTNSDVVLHYFHPYESHC